MVYGTSAVANESAVMWPITAAFVVMTVKVRKHANPNAASSFLPSDNPLPPTPRASWRCEVNGHYITTACNIMRK